MSTFHKSMMANKFVEHIEAHIRELIKKGELPEGSEVCCKICDKTITEIWEGEKQIIQQSTPIVMRRKEES